jgi:chromosome partitioning protein
VARIIAIANQKGGVGKTTTAVNLAASLAAAEQRTLLVDGDPQGNASSGIGLVRDQIGETVYDVLLDAERIEGAIVHGVQFKHLDVLPATPDLAGAEVELVSEDERELAMRRGLERIRDRYDYILIDCPPSLGLITVNMLAAADALLIPLQCEYYALEGLSQLLNTVHLVQQGVNPSLGIDGVVLTMYDARLNLSRQVAADAREYFGAKVFQSVVPRNIRLAEAPSFGKPIILYDVASVGAQAYMGVARELIEMHKDCTSQA